MPGTDITGDNFSLSANAGESRRYLVIEDEADISQLIKLHLQSDTTVVEAEADGRQGLKRAMQEKWDLIVLDLHLPGMDGLEICRQLRANCNYLPILMLTARSTELDRVLGLELGADDYLTKPFSVIELQARIKALIRRVEMLKNVSRNTTQIIERGDLRLDKGSRTLTINDSIIELTAKEFDLLWFFALSPGKAFTRLELLQEVWGYGHDGYEHTVNSHINRLRAKIEKDPAHPTIIHTIWGVGYRFDAEQE